MLHFVRRSASDKLLWGEIQIGLDFGNLADHSRLYFYLSHLVAVAHQ
jgi:hypothetical protein